MLFVTAVQIQWWPMILYIDCHEFFLGGDYSSLLMTSVPEIYLNKHSYKVRYTLDYVGFYVFRKYFEKNARQVPYLNFI